MHNPLIIPIKVIRNPNINIVFVVALLSLAVMLFVSYRIETRLVELNRGKLHATDVLGTLGQVNTALLEADISRSSYLLTGNSSHKLQYQIYAENIPELLVNLKKRMSDNQLQQQRLSRLTTLITRRLDNSESLITDKDSGGAQPEQQSLITAEGVLLMSMIQANISEINNEEQNLLKERRNYEKDTLQILISLLWGGIIVAMAMLSWTYYFARREAASRKESDAILLEKSVALEAANKDMTDLSAMTELLQSSATMKEAGEIMSRYGSKMFEVECGGIYVLNSSRNLVEPLAVWGECRNEPFEPDDCWSLRLVQTHVVQSNSDVQCTHVNTTAETYICVPLASQHETLGVLHVELASHSTVETIEKERAMASAMAERVGLALRNLQLREQLREMSIRDGLTGLLNRRYIEEALSREIARAARYNLPLSVVMIDLDHFKVFNDTFGHEAGDTVLKEFSLILQKHVRGSDIACRFGGEEFTLIIPEVTREEAFRKVEEIREAVKKLQLVSGAQALGMVTISAGVSIFPEDGETGEILLAAADTALYRAKENGRDRVEHFSIPGGSDHEEKPFQVVTQAEE